MGQLTEAEIFDCLMTNLRVAASCADDLARLPAKGPTYRRFIGAIKLMQGAIRQAANWRGDARWLPLDTKFEECHQRAGDWLRGVKLASGGRRMLRAGELHPAFTKLAEIFRAFAVRCETLKNNKTGRSGIIIPKPLPGPHRETRPAGWRKSASGLILPETA